MPAEPPTRLVTAIAERLRAAANLHAEEEARILIEEATSNEELAAMIERRGAGEPLQQIVGWAEFAGQHVAVKPGVFVPRRRTEFLFLQAATHSDPGDVVVDLCCGAAPIGMALLTVEPAVALHCVDIDPAAVECAEENLVGDEVSTYVGDLFGPLPDDIRGRVAVLMANAPYVPSATMDLQPASSRSYEPRATLDGGVDGFEIQRRILAESGEWLAPNGWLLLETSESQAGDLVGLCAEQGFEARVRNSDELEANVVVASR